MNQKWLLMMKKGDFVLIFLALFLLAAAICTIMFGGERSRHGVGMHESQPVAGVTV